MKKMYYAGLRLEEEKSFIELVEAIKQNKDIKIKVLPELCEVIEMRYKTSFNAEREETGLTHIGYDFQYIGIEYKNNYYYIQNADFFSGFDVTGYMKISATQKQQATYSKRFNDYNELLTHLNSEATYTRPLTKTHIQNIYLLELSNMKAISGFREKEILNNLIDIYVSQHDTHAHVLHLVSKDGSTCEYELNRRTFTN